MELSDPNVIATLKLSMLQGRKHATDAPNLPRRLIAWRCRCGRCARCLDEARWERIFQQTFADPDYYQSSLVRYRSPLATSE